MSSRNIFKFWLQFSGLSVKRYFWRKKKKSDTELLKEIQNLNIPFLGSLLREEVDLTSSQFQARMAPASEKTFITEAYTELGLDLILLYPYNPKEKSITHNFIPAHFNLTVVCTGNTLWVSFSTRLPWSSASFDSGLENFATKPLLRICISVV